MAVATAVVRIKRTTVDNVTWTPMVAPIDCNTLTMINTGAVVLKIRTDDADANTEVSINAGQSWTFGGPFTPSHNSNGRFRLLTNDVALFAQLASGSYAVTQSYY